MTASILLQGLTRARWRHFVLLVTIAIALPARAGGFWDWTKAQPDDALALDMPADGIVMLGSFALWEGSQAVREKIGPKTCNLCEGPDNVGLPTTPGNGRGSLNGVDAWFHDEMTGWLISRTSADKVSGVLSYVGGPVFGFSAAIFATGPHASDWAGARASVIVFESIAVTGLLGQGIKFGLARKRPWVRYGHGVDGDVDGDGSYNVNDSDKNFSSLSGHASAMAAATVSASMCATMQGSEATPYLWASSGVLMFVTGSLRLISEAHYFTDVVGGTLLGAGVGVALPLLHKVGGLMGRDLSALSIVPVQDAQGMGMQVSWNGKF